MLDEFKAFAFKGNLIDLAVGVIIGGAFGKVITSIVNDLIMPPLGLLVGGVSFINLFIPLDGKHYNDLADAKAHNAATINYGQFISTLLDFLIVAFVIFLVIKQIARFKKKEETEAPLEKECPLCLSQIPLNAVRCKYCTMDLKSLEHIQS